MNDKDIKEKYAWIVGSSDNMKSFGSALKEARQDERERILKLFKNIFEAVLTDGDYRYSNEYLREIYDIICDKLSVKKVLT
jgi:hypothetical protein